MQGLFVNTDHHKITDMGIPQIIVMRICYTYTVCTYHIAGNLEGVNSGEFGDFLTVHQN